MDETTMAEFKKIIKKARKIKVAEGTVVRWKSSIYNYAAIWAGGNWWLTGTGRFYGGNIMSMEDFVEQVIGSASEFEIATEWETY